MAKVRVSDRTVLRALRYVFPQHEAYEPALMKSGPEGIRLWAILKSKTLIAELDLFPSGIDVLPEDEQTSSFGQHHFSSAVNLVPLRESAGVNVTIDLSPQRTVVEIQDGSIQSQRTLPRMEPGLPKPPALLFQQREVPQVLGVSASLVWDAVKTLDMDEVEAVTVELQKDKTVFASWPEPRLASVKDTAARPSHQGKTRVSHEMLEMAATFGNKEGPIAIDTLDIAFYNGGLLNLRYNFQHGSLTYWLTARPGD